MAQADLADKEKVDAEQKAKVRENKADERVDREEGRELWEEAGETQKHQRTKKRNDARVDDEINRELWEEAGDTEKKQKAEAKHELEESKTAEKHEKREWQYEEKEAKEGHRHSELVKRTEQHPAVKHKDDPLFMSGGMETWQHMQGGMEHPAGWTNSHTDAGGGAGIMTSISKEIGALEHPAQVYTRGLRC